MCNCNCACIHTIHTHEHTHTHSLIHVHTTHLHTCTHTLTLITSDTTHYRIAINSEGIMQFDLGISDSSHKKKLGLRAMDVILFGPPKGTEYISEL